VNLDIANIAVPDITGTSEIAAKGQQEKSSQAVLKSLLKQGAIASNQTAGSATLQVIGVASQVQAAKQSRAQQAELNRVNEQLLNLQFAAAANLDATNDGVFTAKKQLEYDHNQDTMNISYATQTTGSWLIPGMGEEGSR
jgi:hypothetical protein